MAKLLIAVVVLVLAVAGIVLLTTGGDDELYEPPELVAAPVAPERSDSFELGAFSTDPTTFPLLIVGEDDIVIRGGALSDDAEGWITADTGSTGMTGGDLVLKGRRGGGESFGLVATSDAVVGTTETTVYAERRAENVSLGRYDESGIEVERQLGEVLIRALGETMNPLVLGSTGPVAVFRGVPAGPVVALDAQVSVDGSVEGRVTVEGKTEIGALLDYLAALSEAGRLGTGEDGESVEVSGVTLEVYGPAGTEAAVVLEPTEVDGAFRVRGAARRTSGWGSLPQIMNADPEPRGAGVLVLFSGSTVGVSP